MEEIIRQLLPQMPFVVLLALAIWKLYTDGRADRQYMMDLLEKSYLQLAKMNGETPEQHNDTLMQRPDK